MQTRDELLNGLGEAVSIIRQLANIQQRLNQVRNQYQRILPRKKMSKRVKSYWIIIIPLWTMGLMAEFGPLVGITYAVINIVIIPHDSFHESQIWIPAIRGNRTTYTHISSTFQVAALFL